METKQIIKYKNYIFVPYSGYSGVMSDVSDGYLKESLDGNTKIKLHHRNYRILGIADECVNSPYAEIFAEELVEKDEFGGYLDYELEEHNYDSAVDSVQTLFRTLGVSPNDYILRDETI
jgi:hypothetical protein